MRFRPVAHDQDTAQTIDSPAGGKTEGGARRLRKFAAIARNVEAGATRIGSDVGEVPEGRIQLWSGPLRGDDRRLRRALANQTVSFKLAKRLAHRDQADAEAVCNIGFLGSAAPTRYIPSAIDSRRISTSWR